MVPTFIFVPEVFSLHGRIRHPGNQLTMALGFNPYAIYSFKSGHDQFKSGHELDFFVTDGLEIELA